MLTLVYLCVLTHIRISLATLQFLSDASLAQSILPLFRLQDVVPRSPLRLVGASSSHKPYLVCWFEL